MLQDEQNRLCFAPTRSCTKHYIELVAMWPIQDNSLFRFWKASEEWSGYLWFAPFSFFFEKRFRIQNFMGFGSKYWYYLSNWPDISHIYMEWKLRAMESVNWHECARVVLDTACRVLLGNDMLSCLCKTSLELRLDALKRFSTFICERLSCFKCSNRCFNILFFNFSMFVWRLNGFLQLSVGNVRKWVRCRCA